MLKQKIRKAFGLAIALIVCCQYVSAQSKFSLINEIPFYKYTIPHKVKYLHSGDEIKVHLYILPNRGNKTVVKDLYGNYVKPDSGSKDITYSGTIKTKNDSVLSIAYDGEEIETDLYCKYKNCQPFNTRGDSLNDSIVKIHNDVIDTSLDTTNNPEPDYYLCESETKNFNFYGDSIINIHLNKIDYVTFDNSGNFPDNTFNYVLICTSFAAAFIAAPAASFNYSNDAFNTHRYFNIMVPSLSFFAVDLTLNLVLTHERKYKVKLGLK